MYLTQNQIGDQGAQYLADGLKANQVSSRIDYMVILHFCSSLHKEIISFYESSHSYDIDVFHLEKWKLYAVIQWIIDHLGEQNIYK